MKTIATFVAAALTLASVTATAHAAEPARKTVAYADLDLSSPAGVDSFNRRVRAAAKNVCGDAPARRSLAEDIRIGRCVDGAIAGHKRPTAA
jgi:UrcA family protein